MSGAGDDSQRGGSVSGMETGLLGMEMEDEIRAGGWVGGAHGWGKRPEVR